MDVKVAEPLETVEADEDMRDYARVRRVELESVEDPRYYSFEEFMATIGEGEFGGFTMDFTMDFAMDEYSNVLSIITDTNNDAPMRWEITVISDFDAPITIRNIGTNKQMSFDISGVIGDVIIIDTGKYTATKNGVSILADRVPGSEWLQLSGNDSFVVFSEDGGLLESDFDVNVYFRNVLL